jgi:hypothetical protein
MFGYNRLQTEQFFVSFSFSNINLYIKAEIQLLKHETIWKQITVLFFILDFIGFMVIDIYLWILGL